MRAGHLVTLALEADAPPTGGETVKGLQEPKKTDKKPAQKTLKERWKAKRAATRQSRSLGV